MHNATAAGPSRGLLDVIFGSSKKTPEDAEAGGQGFESLMNFIKTMNGEKKEEQSAVLSRTLRETTPGKDIVDSNVVGMPGMKAAAATDAEGQLALAIAQENKEQQEKLNELSLLLGIPVQSQQQAMPLPKAMRGQEPIPELSLEKVNATLRQKELPPLDQEELKLLQAVNSKLEQVQAPKAMVASAGAVAIPGEQALDPRLQQEMAKKGIDPRKLKGAETSASPVSGTQEKMISTESYLQMHESVGKAPVKEATGKGVEVVGGEATASPAATQGSLTSAAITGAGSKGLELGSKKERALELPEGAKPAKLDAAGGAFGASMSQQLNEVSQHELNLSGMEKPDQFRDVLMNEVGSGVALHAHKGGGEMRLVLNPDDMGEVKLKISTKNGKVEVQVTADNNDVANTIRGGSKELESALKDQNLTLAKFDVSVADPSSVASLENKPSLNEQFLSQQNQQQFGQGAGAEDGRNNRWDNNRQGGTYASLTEDNRRSSAKSANPVPKQAARVGSRRLDVVA